MIVLGLTTMGASAACIIKDGKLIAAVEEERLSRIKNDGAFPILSIKEVLKISSTDIQEVDVIAVYWKPYVILPRAIGVIKKVFQKPKGISVLLESVKQMMLNQPKKNERPEDTGSWSHLFNLKSKIINDIGNTNAKIRFFDHHLSHQVYAEAMRDWTEYYSLSYDGGGEKLSTQLVYVNGDKRTTIKEFNWPNSLGHFYSFFTGFLGFKMLEGEYKMMGLAPYGEPLYKDILEKYFISVNKGRYRLNTRLCDYHSALKGEFSDDVDRLLCARRQPDQKPTEEHLNLAASVQHVYENCLKEICGHTEKSKKLVISGGCALNVTANGRLLEQNIFEDIIIPPAPHDAGCSIGAAILGGGISKPKNIANIRSPYLGREYSTEYIKVALEKSGLEFEQIQDIEIYSKRVSKELTQNKIIAWFQGGAEFGPRALGNRSFLANPRTDDIREIINAKIKKRELFRPFAPSVLEEKASEYFELNQTSPYMNIVANVREEKKSEIPAVTHTDGTARVHTVSSESNFKYYSLIKAFEEELGTPVLLNTSFNIQEPIVYSPEDAINTFSKSGVDILAIDEFVAWRK